MADYIKREDMHSAIEKDTNFGWYTSDGSVAFSKSEVHEMLNTIPSADVAEVKHGEWCEFMKDPINQRNYGGQTGYYECSNCKFVEDYRPNFCPNCGARMDGGT